MEKKSLTIVNIYTFKIIAALYRNDTKGHNVFQLTLYYTLYDGIYNVVRY